MLILKFVAVVDLLHRNYVGYCSTSEVYLIITTFKKLSNILYSFTFKY